MGSRMRVKPMQNIEEGCHKSEMGSQVTFDTMKDMFEVTNTGQRREQDFIEHPFTPGFVRAQQEIAVGFARFGKAQVAQGHGQTIKLMRQRTKVLVMDIVGTPVPRHDLRLTLNQSR